MDRSAIFARTSADRRIVADVLESLTQEQWRADSLCEGWSVRHVAGHLLQPFLVGFGRFFATAVRYRGDTARTVDHFAHRLAERSPAEIIAALRDHADDEIDPPRVGPMGQLADTAIHLRDVARPLGLSADVPREDWVTLLDYVTSAQVAPAVVPEGRLAGLSLRATDADRVHGHGAEIAGPVEALVMAAAGRSVALADLDGEGVELLARRLRTQVR